MVATLQPKLLSRFGLLDEVLGPPSEFISRPKVDSHPCFLMFDDRLSTRAKYGNRGDLSRHCGEQIAGQRIVQMRMPIEVQTGDQGLGRIWLTQKMNVIPRFSERRKSLELLQLRPGSNDDKMKILTNTRQ